MTLNESQTRALLIDPMLRTAGWRLDDKTQVDTEIPVDGYDKEPWNGVTDYCLFDPTGDVLAVVEAKRSSRNPREAYERTALTGRRCFRCRAARLAPSVVCPSVLTQA